MSSLDSTAVVEDGALVITFNVGSIVNRLGGIETGHRERLDWIDGWLSR